MESNAGFFLTSIRRVTALEPNRLYIAIAAKGDSPEGYADATIEIEMLGNEHMQFSLAELEKAAIKRAKAAFGLMGSLQGEA